MELPQTERLSVTPITIGAALALLLIGGVIWWYAQSQGSSTVETRDEAIDAVTAPIIEVPSSDVVGNKAPELNPIERANPFKDSYKNPFE